MNNAIMGFTDEEIALEHKRRQQLASVLRHLESTSSRAASIDGQLKSIRAALVCLKSGGTLADNDPALYLW